MKNKKTKIFRLGLISYILSLISVFMPTSILIDPVESNIMWNLGFIVFFSKTGLSIGFFYNNMRFILTIIYISMILIGTGLLFNFSKQILIDEIVWKQGILGGIINLGMSIFYFLIMIVLEPGLYWVVFLPNLGLILPFISGIIGIIAGIKSLKLRVK
ncbi:MAG: hypothetical protein ACTSSM_12085 [Promethearchaeota archaeon]